MVGSPVDITQSLGRGTSLGTSGHHVPPDRMQYQEHSIGQVTILPHARLGCHLKDTSDKLRLNGRLEKYLL
jgi:hypothetical protein